MKEIIDYNILEVISDDAKKNKLCCLLFYYFGTNCFLQDTFLLNDIYCLKVESINRKLLFIIQEYNRKDKSLEALIMPFTCYRNIFSFIVKDNKVIELHNNVNCNLQELIDVVQENNNKKGDKNNMKVDDMIITSSYKSNKDLNVALVNYMKAKQKRLEEFHLIHDYFNEKDAEYIMKWSEEDCMGIMRELHYFYDKRTCITMSDICVFCIREKKLFCYSCESCGYGKNHKICHYGDSDSDWGKLTTMVDISAIFTKEWFNKTYNKYIKPHVNIKTEYEKAIDECLNQITIFNCFESIRVLLAEYKPNIQLYGIYHTNSKNKMDISISGVPYTFYFDSVDRLKNIFYNKL